MKKSGSFFVFSVVVAVLFFSGCSQSRQETQSPSFDVKATISADCVVRYYKSNKSFYITRQQHEYDPSAGFFHAVSNEPIGTIECSLLKDDYQSSGQKERSLSDLPESFWSKNLAVSVFYGFCAGGDFLETDSMFPSENVKIEGRWFTPLKPQWPGDVSLTLLQSPDTKRIDYVQLEDEKEGLIWLIRYYNVRYSKEMQKRVPYLIDIYDIQNGVAEKKLMVRFGYKDIRKTKNQNIPD